MQNDLTANLDRALKNIKPNAILKRQADVESAVALSNSLDLPIHLDTPKNWDSLAAFAILQQYLSDKTNKTTIMDAGGEDYSVILPQLRKAGYSNFTCVNLVYDSPFVKNGIKYQHGDVTKTDFPDDYFDAITCLSVIEHGVDINLYFKEMSRILKPGGILFTSFDYWHTKIDTRGCFAYGVPVEIFDLHTAVSMVKVASEFHLETIGPIDLTCDEKVVFWKEQNLAYTFAYFTMRKIIAG